MNYEGIKGEWKVVELGEKDSKQMFIVSNKSENIIAVYLPKHEITKELKATANLMANSYELFKALQDAISLLKQTTEFEVLDSWQTKIKELENSLSKMDSTHY